MQERSLAVLGTEVYSILPTIPFISCRGKGSHGLSADVAQCADTQVEPGPKFPHRLGATDGPCAVPAASVTAQRAAWCVAPANLDGITRSGGISSSPRARALQRPPATAARSRLDRAAPGSGVRF